VVACQATFFVFVGIDFAIMPAKQTLIYGAAPGRRWMMAEIFWDWVQNY